MLMDPDRGGADVDHLQVAVIGLRYRLEDTVPDPDLCPAPKPVGAGGGRSVALRNVGPGRAGAQAPINPIQDLAVVRARDTARLVRQQWLYDRPLEVAQLVAARVHRSTSRHLESPHAASREDIYELAT